MVTTYYFKENIVGTKCAYERIYYDTEFGELKKNDSKWKGLDKKDNNELFKKIEDILNNNYGDKKIDFNDGTNWTLGNGTYLENIRYTAEFVDNINELLNNCSKEKAAVRDIETGELICDSNDMKNKNSYLIRYIDNITNITKYFHDEIISLGNFIENKGKKGYIKTFEQEKKIIMNKFTSISADLNNYKNDFLKKVYDYINPSKNWGYYLVTIFYSILLVISLVCCVLLWLDTIIKNQKIIMLLMHIFWNILKYFSFSFFILGAAYGILFKFARDLIGYNKFLFSNNNLAPDVKTYLLPNGTSKEFLRFCINDENNNYLENIDLSISKILLNLTTNLKQMKNTFERYDPNDFKDFKKNFTCYKVINYQMIRKLQDDDNDDISDIPSSDTILLNFSFAGNAFKEMLNKMNAIIYQINGGLRFLENEKNITRDIEDFEQKLSLFNCGYLKSEIQILYDSLYELSIESRILCALCCCIGFFGEISVLFYLLVMYHYDKEKFRERDSIVLVRKKRLQNDEQESKNEFKSKENPNYIKENNKRLDFEYEF